MGEFFGKIASTRSPQRTQGQTCTKRRNGLFHPLSTLPHSPLVWKETKLLFTICQTTDRNGTGLSFEWMAKDSGGVKAFIFRQPWCFCRRTKPYWVSKNKHNIRSSRKKSSHPRSLARKGETAQWLAWQHYHVPSCLCSWMSYFPSTHTHESTRLIHRAAIYKSTSAKRFRDWLFVATW